MWRIPYRSSVAGTIVLLAIMIRAASGADTANTRQIDAIFADLKSATAPGAAVLVIKDGRVVFRRGYGVTDLRTLRRIDETTNFRLASVTKQFTAMAVMLLVHDGKLRYENRLTDIFPEFPEYGKTITIRNLLNHTSGLLDYEDLMPKYEGVPGDQIPQIQDSGVFDLLKQQRTTKFVPGTKWDYSNSGYVLLGLVVAKVSGVPFGQFLHNRIFVPLQMTRTVAYEKGKNEVSNRAFGHSKINAKWQETDQSPTSATLGDGGIYSSLEDLEKWDRGLRNHTLLSELEMLPAFTAVSVSDNSVREPDGTPAAYGFGWFLNAYRSHRRMWHYGETMGFRTSIQRFVNEGLTVIVLCNRTDLNPSQLALRVADLYVP